MGATAISIQSGWRWCRKCEGLFFVGNSGKGRCAAGGMHDDTGSGHYLLQLAPPGQANWRRCRKCEGLFFFGNNKADGFPSFGRCAVAGGAIGNNHEPVLSDQFFVNLNSFFGSLGSQSDWRWCRKCEGLFFSGNAANGRCAAGGSHDGINSGNYNLPKEWV